MIGVAEKIFGEAQINFILIFGREDQKKRSSTWPFTFFRGASLAPEGGALLLPGGAGRDLMVRISLLAHTFRGEDQKKKKGLRRKIVGSVLGCSRVFRHGTKFRSRLWDTNSFFGGTGSEIHSSGTGPVTFFWGTILA